jgi:hypothetical protein
MRRRGLIPPTARVSCDAARFQDFESTDDHEEPHYLPGQNIIKNSPAVAAGFGIRIKVLNDTFR